VSVCLSVSARSYGCLFGVKSRWSRA